MSIPELIAKIETLLPQTQCERCGFKGCKPYAENLVRNGSAVNLCHPGGQPTSDAIARLLKKPKIDVENPGPKKVAFIREFDCIGCTKCIQACPVDAIIGAAKQTHTVITSECTGCELCVPVCPVDCIDLKQGAEVSWHVGQPASFKARIDHAKARFVARKERLMMLESQKKKKHHSKTSIDIQSELAQCVSRAQEKSRPYE